MALRRALMSRNKVDLNIRLIRLSAQEVMTDQPVEVVRSGDACIDLIVDHLRLLGEIVAKLLSNVCCLLERGPIRHVNDHLKLAFVVERQHLDAYPLEGNKCHRSKKQNDNPSKEEPTNAWAEDERIHEPPIELCGPALRFVYDTPPACF